MGFYRGQPTNPNQVKNIKIRPQFHFGTIFMRVIRIPSHSYFSFYTSSVLADLGPTKVESSYKDRLLAVFSMFRIST